MKGWVGLVGWPVADGLPTLVVIHQLQVERKTGKVRQSETDVLPLCYATNEICSEQVISLFFPVNMIAQYVPVVGRLHCIASTIWTWSPAMEWLLWVSKLCRNFEGFWILFVETVNYFWLFDMLRNALWATGRNINWNTNMDSTRIIKIECAVNLTAWAWGDFVRQSPVVESKEILKLGSFVLITLTQRIWRTAIWSNRSGNWHNCITTYFSPHRTMKPSAHYTHTRTHTHAHTHTHTHARLMALYPGLPRWAGTRKVKPVWISLKQEIVSGSGIVRDICKSAPRSRQVTTPAPRRSVFYRPDAVPAAEPTASKHWRQIVCTF